MAPVVARRPGGQAASFLAFSAVPPSPPISPRRWGLAKGMAQHFQGSGHTSLLGWRAGRGHAFLFGCRYYSVWLRRAARVSRDQGSPRQAARRALERHREDGEESGTGRQPTVRLQETLLQPKREAEGPPQRTRQWALLWPPPGPNNKNSHYRSNHTSNTIE